jgi:DNA polymerase III subunit delta'
MFDFIDIDKDVLDEEADRFRAFPHPREMLACHGLEAQERMLVESWRSGKMHHAWLFAGPEGVGKAVLAYRFARFLLAKPDADVDNLSVPADHPVAGQVARLAHPDLAVIRRSLAKDGKNLRTEIAVDDVREGLSVFRTTSGADGWRIAIVDAADDLNRSSANALLKMLEEPPARALFILIAHSPGSLLPTIRSRCRLLRFGALPEEAVATAAAAVSGIDLADAREAAAQADGSVRRALAALDPEAKALVAAAEKAFAAGGGKPAQMLADNLTGRAKAEAFQQFLDIVEMRLRILPGDAGAGGEALAARAELWEKLRRSAREVEAYNLDRRPFVLSVLGDLREIERQSR